MTKQRIQLICVEFIGQSVINNEINVINADTTAHKQADSAYWENLLGA